MKLKKMRNTNKKNTILKCLWYLIFPYYTKSNKYFLFVLFLFLSIFLNAQELIKLPNYEPYIDRLTYKETIETNKNFNELYKISENLFNSNPNLELISLSDSRFYSIGKFLFDKYTVKFNFNIILKGNKLNYSFYDFTFLEITKNKTIKYIPIEKKIFFIRQIPHEYNALIQNIDKKTKELINSLKKEFSLQNYDEILSKKDTSLTIKRDELKYKLNMSGNELIFFQDHYYTGITITLLGPAISLLAFITKPGEQKIPIILGGIISLSGIIVMLESISHAGKAGKILKQIN